MAGETGRTPSDPDAGDDRPQRPDFAAPGLEPTVVMAVPSTAIHPTPAPPPETQGRRPRSRALMITVITVLAVLTILVAGDRVANAVAQNVLATQLQSELSTPDKPDVRIGGFPFVTQALGGTFSSVTVTAENATVTDGETSVAVAQLDASISDITTTDRYATIVAGQGEATAVVDWSSVSAVAGQELGYVADDRMRIDFSVPIGRLSIEGYVTGRPQLDVEAQTITVADPQVSVASVDVPQAVVNAVSRLVLQPYPIEDLPYDIEVTDLTVQPDGISLTGTGSDIPLRGR